ncbi:MAG: hypothetical protein ACE5EN_07640 [Nitrospinota bacterium]
MKKKEDLYITLIRYGREHLKNGTDTDAAYNYLKEQGFVFEEKNQALFGNVFHTIFYRPVITRGNYFLKLEYYFQLLEYEELNEARNNSSWAHFFAICAIMISIMVGGYQIFKPSEVKLIPSQQKQITNLNKKLSDLNQKIDE